jgi:hypothetical protein
MARVLSDYGQRATGNGQRMSETDEETAPRP